MPRYERGKNKRSERIVAAGGLDVPTPMPKFVEPRCHVCKHENRNHIDRLLAMQTPYAEVARYFSTDEDKLSSKSVASHAKNHLQFEDDAIRKIIEYEAGIAQENLEDGVKGAFLRRTALDVSIKKVFDGIISGEIQIEAKDVVKMIELRERLDQNSATAQIENYEIQFNAFKKAIQEICAPEVHFQILTRTKELLDLPTQPALQAPK